MQVTFYLTQASANTAAGPFNISGTTSGGAANTVEIQAGVSKSTLLAGYTEEIAVGALHQSPHRPATLVRSAVAGELQ